MNTPSIRCLIALFMSLVMSNVMTAAASVKVESLAPTRQVFEELSQAEQVDELNNFVASDEVREELKKHGVSQEEISQRLAALSKDEIKQLHSQIIEARSGGLLVEILIIVLIIYLIRRM